MATRTKDNTLRNRWVQLELNLKGEIPHLSSFLLRIDDFQELRVKARPDGTCLGIVKGYDSDGSPIVAFGVGYDPILALMALDASIQGNNWREDKPWDGKKK